MPIFNYIYLSPPYVSVQPTASIYNVKLPNSSPLTFGYIQQINSATTKYIVGDRILYPQSITDPVIIIGSTQYSEINENVIILKETFVTPT